MRATALILLVAVTAFGEVPEDVSNAPAITIGKETAGPVIWRVKAGSWAGALAVAPGKVLVGARLGKAATYEDLGAAMECFDTRTGALLWSAGHAPVGERILDMGEPILSTPWIEGDRAWYISNRDELVCVNLQPTTPAANIIWKLDMAKELGVFRRGAGDAGSPSGSPVVLGDLVFCVTGEGCRRGGDKGAAPSFLAVHKTTGKVAWSSSAPGENIIYAQWSSPVVAHVNGRDQIIFPGGDGWLYGFEPETGVPIWKVDCNAPSDRPWKIDPGSPQFEEGKMKNFFMGAPVTHGDTLFVGLNLDFELQPGNAPLLAIALGYKGDVTGMAIRWKFQHPEFLNTFGSAAFADGIVYALGRNAVLFALDEKTGHELWHSRFCKEGHAWFFGSPLVANGKVIVGDEDGELFVYAAGRAKKCLARFDFPSPLRTAPVLDKDAMYLSVNDSLYKLRLP